jgi:hypothetical protein
MAQKNQEVNNEKSQISSLRLFLRKNFLAEMSRRAPRRANILVKIDRIEAAKEDRYSSVK